jgi:hypothetical protein
MLNEQVPPPVSHPAPALAPTAPGSAHAPNPLPHRRALARLHRHAHAHEPHLPTPDAHGAPGSPQRRTRCWHQPEVVWINPPPPEIGINPAKLVVGA